MNSPDSSTRSILRALLVAALILAAAAAVQWLTPEHLSEEMGRRFTQVLLGSLVIFYANAAPKALTSLRAMRCDPAKEQAARRFSGWALVLGGLAYVLVWLFAPLDIAAPLAIGLLGLSVLTVIVRLFASGKRALALLAAISIGATPAHAQQAATGEWHGQLTTPSGAITLVIRIRMHADSGHVGDLESVDQAPGQRIAISRITLTDRTLSFTIPSINARYDGEWNEAASEWRGNYRQGIELPLVLKPGPPPAAPVIAGLDGTWRGTLTRDTTTLRLVLKVATSSRGTRVLLDSPDAGSLGMRVDRFEREGDRVRFAVPLAAVEFDGTLDAGATRLTGRWTRQGMAAVTVNFELDRSGAPAEVVRTQWPVTPEGYRALDVTFPNPPADGVTLAGTLTLPDASRPVPAVVLLSGSGAQDRDESIWGHKPFAVLADHLSRQGIAVLRYDDRGFAQSTGNHASATSADFAADANAAVRYLLSRPEIDPGAIGLAGHSEGGLIGPLAAVENGKVAFVVLLAGPGTPAIQVMLSQRRAFAETQGVTDAQLAPSQAVMESLYRVAASNTDSIAAAARLREILTADAMAVLGVPPTQREMIVDLNLTPWMRYFLRYDPAPTLARLRIPVLALGGSLDRQVVSAENLPAIRQALVANPDVTVVELPGLNHMFQPTRTGTMSEYREIPETFAPAAMQLVTRWINDRFGAGAARR